VVYEKNFAEWPHQCSEMKLPSAKMQIKIEASTVAETNHLRPCQSHLEIAKTQFTSVAPWCYGRKGICTPIDKMI
jgi:hypothetical protein